MIERLKRYGLSERAMLILLVIDEASARNWDTGRYLKYWLPGEKWVPTRISSLRREITIGCASDVAILKSLLRKGLIERPPGVPDLMPHAYGVTEDGRLAAEDIIAHLGRS